MLEPAHRAFVVGLTGGIASGKTAVSDGLARRGAMIVDTDVIAREVVAPGSVGLQAVVAHFGSHMRQADGSLDRRAMRTQVFSNPQDRQVLESILHPLIRAEVAARTQTLPAGYPYFVVVIPLLTEGNRYPFLDHIVVVDVTPEVQLARLRQRDAINQELALAMVQAQAGRQQRLALADTVLDNNGDRAELETQLDHLHARLLSISRTPRLA